MPNRSARMSRSTPALPNSMRRAVRALAPIGCVGGRGVCSRARPCRGRASYVASLRGLPPLAPFSRAAWALAWLRAAPPLRCALLSVCKPVNASSSDSTMMLAPGSRSEKDLGASSCPNAKQKSPSRLRWAFLFVSSVFSCVRVNNFSRIHVEDAPTFHRFRYRPIGAKRNCGFEHRLFADVNPFHFYRPSGPSVTD